MAGFAMAFATGAPRTLLRGSLISTVWGVGLLAEAVIRVPLVHLLPVDVAVGVTEVLFAGTFVLLIAWNGRREARARRGRPRRGSAPSPTGGTAG
ncbi:hypothetical protein GCM10023175_00800 [Pseudonocardia xishanensis]|uniref:Uncharacterized protein n=1 Tax=Pseudonocardia xishanensis TaxID=630995 RepID=A0ABP8RCV6_9PSEU